jgi:hypothetical protein
MIKTMHRKTKFPDYEISLDLSVYLGFRHWGVAWRESFRDGNGGLSETHNRQSKGQRSIPMSVTNALRFAQIVVRWSANLYTASFWGPKASGSQRLRILATFQNVIPGAPWHNKFAVWKYDQWAFPVRWSRKKSRIVMTQTKFSSRPIKYFSTAVP